MGIGMNIGYVSDEVTLVQNMTAVEHLKLFGKVKGMTNRDIEATSQYLLRKLNFIEYENYIVKKMSGGTQRKL